VSQLLAHLDYLDEAIATLSQAIEAHLAPFAGAVARVQTIPGVKQRTVEALVAEIGVDMTRFPTPGHLASWAGLCPGNNETAGKRRRVRTRKGGRWLKEVFPNPAEGNSIHIYAYVNQTSRSIAGRHVGILNTKRWVAPYSITSPLPKQSTQKMEFGKFNR
jgi:hypothetical protein